MIKKNFFLILKKTFLDNLKTHGFSSPFPSSSLSSISVRVMSVAAAG